MKDTNKFIFASFIILACAVGVFLGSLLGGGTGCCQRMMQDDCCKKMMEECCKKGDAPMPPAPGDMHKHGDKTAHHQMMDSVLQVTPEQKAALDKHRAIMDSTFKTLRTQKKDAEKALKEALDSGDAAKIDEAKKQILAADEALLNQRVDGVSEFNKILTKEQVERFHAFHKERFEKFKKHRHPMEPGKPMPPEPQN